MENIIKFLENQNKKLYVTAQGCELINHAQEMMTRECIATNGKDRKTNYVCKQLLVLYLELGNAFLQIIQMHQSRGIIIL